MLPRAPELRTPRLRLVPSAPGDAPCILEYAGDARFFEFLPVDPPIPYTLADAREHLRELLALARRGLPSWRMERSDGATVGSVRFRPDGGLPELGYGIAPALWRQGYASEACAAVVAWALPQVPAITARCDPRNEASLRVLRGLGFAPDGSDEEGRLRFRLQGGAAGDAVGAAVSPDPPRR